MPHDDFEQTDVLTDHDYDGIQEYDNPLPGWWKWLFWGTIFFSIAYVGLYHIRPDQGIHDKYQSRVASFFEGQLEQLGFSEPSNEAIVGLMNEEDVMNAMAATFAGNCGQCHRDDGGGNIGPNLTDDHFKNVKSPEELFNVIANGIPGTSMPAWNTRMRDPQIIMLAAYVARLRGSSPDTPKEPEGVELPPWETFVSPPIDDSTRGGNAADGDSQTLP